MKRYSGSETVEPGLYFNLRQLSFKSVETTGKLPGTAKDVYRRVPVLAMLLVGPVMGLAFVVFLPFIGFAMAGWLLFTKASRLGRPMRTPIRPAPTLAGGSDALPPAAAEKLDPTERHAA
jgi:hypothetical protein